MADFRRRMSRDQNWSIIILRFPCDKENDWWSGIAFFVKKNLVIFWTVSWTQRQTYNCFSSFQQNILPYSWSSCIQFFHKSGSSALTLAETSICFITPPFSYTKNFVRIAHICPKKIKHFLKKSFSYNLWSNELVFFRFGQVGFKSHTSYFQLNIVTCSFLPPSLNLLANDF